VSDVFDDGVKLPAGYYPAHDFPSFGDLPTHALDAELTLYWPWVRTCWESESSALLTQVDSCGDSGQTITA